MSERSYHGATSRSLKERKKERKTENTKKQPKKTKQKL